MWIPTVPKAMTKILPLNSMNRGLKGAWMELQLKWFTLGEVQGGDRNKIFVYFFKQNPLLQLPLRGRECKLLC